MLSFSGSLHILPSLEGKGDGVHFGNIVIS
jgi:hypothetical protein